MANAARVNAGVIYFPIEQCSACHVYTRELYSRTMEGKKYCLECINRGAGLEDLEKAGMNRFISKEERNAAKENGFYVPSPFEDDHPLGFNEPY